MKSTVRRFGRVFISWRHAPLALALLLALFHFSFLMHYFEPAISTPDANGYFAQARHLVDTGHSYLAKESPLQFVEGHWIEAENDRVYSYYPPGLSVVVAPVLRFFGWKAALIVNPILATASIVLVFFISRAWIGGWYGLAASALLALNGVANDHALAGDAHTATLFFLLAALAALVRYERKSSAIFLFLCGLLAGMVPTIRYPEVFIAPAFLLFIVLGKTQWKERIGHASLWFAGFQIPLVMLMIRNRMAFGGFLSTGYTTHDGIIDFGFSYFIAHYQSYIEMLGGSGVGVLFGLGAAGIVFLCMRRETLKYGAFFAAYTIPVTLLYMAYYWNAGMGSARFLMPTFPIYIIAGLWLVSMVAESNVRAAIAVTAVIILLTAVVNVPNTTMVLSQYRKTNTALARLTDTLNKKAEPGDIVVTQSQISQHLEYAGSWKLAGEPSDLFSGMGRRQFGGQRLRMQTSERGRDRMPMLAGPGGRRQMLSGEEYAKELVRWADGDKKVYIVCSEDRLEDFRKAYEEYGDMTVVAKMAFGGSESSELNADGSDGEGLAGNTMETGSPGEGMNEEGGPGVPSSERGGTERRDFNDADAGFEDENFDNPRDFPGPDMLPGGFGGGMNMPERGDMSMRPGMRGLPGRSQRGGMPFMNGPQMRGAGGAMPGNMAALSGTWVIVKWALNGK